MFSQNRNQPIWTEFREYFPHAERKIDVYSTLSRKLILFGSFYSYIRADKVT
jgi:hypothetical protein